MRLSLKPRLFGSALAVTWLVIAQLAYAGDAQIEGGATDNVEQILDDAPAVVSLSARAKVGIGTRIRKKKSQETFARDTSVQWPLSQKRMSRFP